jgi:LPS export ABC transporter protein LptC
MFFAYVHCGCFAPLHPPPITGPVAGRWRGIDRVTPRNSLMGLLLVAAFLPGAAEEAPPVQSRPAAAGLAVTGMTFVRSDGEVADMVVEAERGRLDPETNLVHLETVQTRVQGNATRSGFELTCDKGELELQTHALLATGNVHGRTADGRAFSADWVRYDPKRDLAYTDSPVEIEDETGSLHGGGFRYHVREGRFRLLGGATVRREN